MILTFRIKWTHCILELELEFEGGLGIIPIHCDLTDLLCSGHCEMSGMSVPNSVMHS